MHLNHPWNHPHPAPSPALWENCLPRNWPQVPKRLGTAAAFLAYRTLDVKDVFSICAVRESYGS